MSDDIWCNLRDSMWHPKGVTHGKSHVVHLKGMAHIEPCVAD